jgi:hypothetical protein
LRSPAMGRAGGEQRARWRAGRLRSTSRDAAGVPARQLLALALDGLLTSLLSPDRPCQALDTAAPNTRLEFAKTLSLGGGIRTFASEIRVPLASRWACSESGARSLTLHPAHGIGTSGTIPDAHQPVRFPASKGGVPSLRQCVAKGILSVFRDLPGLPGTHCS